MKTRTAPAPVADQLEQTTITTSSKEKTSPSNHRQQPDGKITEQTSTEGRQEIQKPADDEQISQKQISLVQETWGLVSGDLEKVGVDFYMRLFKANPDVLQLFSFRDINKSSDDIMRADDRLKRQGLVTMQHVDLAVNSLNDLGSIVPALRDLGGRHAMYKVEEHHYVLVGSVLLDTLNDGLGDKFTLEVKEAWTVVYGIVANTMQAGAREVLEE